MDAAALIGLASLAGKSTADAAETWAAAGFHPVILHGIDASGACTCGKPDRHPDGKGAGKHPVDSAWQQSGLDIRALVRRLRGTPAPRNLGLRMGVQPGGDRLLAIDDDGGLSDFEARHGGLPPTLTLASGGGGKHRIFRVPTGIDFKNSVRVDGLAVDLRCDGGQIVVAPSLHHSGKRYTVGDLRQVGELPDAFVELLRDKPAAAPAAPDISSWTLGGLRNQDERVLAYCRRKAQEDGSVQGNNGSAALARWAGCVFWRLGLSEAEGMPLLAEMNRIGASPPWSDAEIRHAAQNGMKPHPSRSEPRGHLLEEWKREDARKADERDRLRKPKRAGAHDDDFGPPPEAYFEGNAAVETIEQSDGTGGHVARNNVRRGPWGGTGETPMQWRLPDDSPTGVIRSPTVRVPAPEDWTALETAVQECPDVLPADKSGMKDVTSMAVAERLLRQIDQFHEAFVFDGGRYWLYHEGIYRRLPAWWIKRSFQLYHGAKSVQQEVGASPGVPWFSNAGNIASATANLQTLLEARQATPGDRSFFGDSPTLAVFGSKTLLWDKGTRGIRLEPNAPEHRATFAYPFEFELNGAEPEYLLRIMREDMFAGVAPAETELRVLRIRQQMGLALLGAQRIANLHSVLIMLGQGHDGKSTLLGILQACMPPGAWAVMHPQDLCSGIGDGAEARADLHGLFAVMCDDVSARSMRDSSTYKTATAYGSIRGRHFGSGVNSFQVDVRATWILACQELWQTADKTRGFQRRHCIVEFPNSIKDGEADKALRAKVLAHEQREIVLWCVRAALDLLAGDELAQPECSARLMRAWMLGDDDVASFLEANTLDCSASPKESWPKTEELWKAYVNWCGWVGGAGKGRHSNLVHFSRKARQAKGVQLASSGRDKVSRISRRVGVPS